ncbi:DUF397 domain-containing protein [Streptomyces sp. Isolate_219]|uniref:DUF397 domain-containing protein n=1 Tax=Streptomyces sp. Isolate_219 TaxID=2950110 RepID=UPI0021C67416|nr:DUF397 domain-containing protein [Streptomyces sp. Isolate_219]MCR8576424.1 DUF397 domain-containing protein [Streptomyces sp. Isolate_219]
MTTETPRWFKSSYSNNGGACIEVADNQPNILVRDSKLGAESPVMDLPRAAWSGLVEFAKGA